MLKRILRSMLRVLRAWRFVRLVNKKNKIIGYKDPIMVGLYSGRKYKFVNKEDIISEFRVYAIKKPKRAYIARRTYATATSKDYILPHKQGGLVFLEVNPSLGEDFIPLSGLIKSLFRELKPVEQVAALVTAYGVLYGVYAIIMKWLDTIAG